MLSIAPRRFIGYVLAGLALLLFGSYAGLQVGRGDLGQGTSAGGGSGAPGLSRELSDTAVSGGEPMVDATKDGAPVLDAAKVISNGNVTISGGDVATLRAQAIAVVRRLGGSISAEETSADAGGRVSLSVLTVRVTSAVFDKAMAEFGGLGHFVNAGRSSEDVTTQVIDIDAKVKVQTASVARIRELLGRAKSIRDIVSLESELADRQAELDSLRSQQKWLADQTERSTITLTIDKRAKAPRSTNPFVSGLQGGWAALLASFSALIKVFGALLPWLIVLIPVGLGWRLWRRRTTARPTPDETNDRPQTS